MKWKQFFLIVAVSAVSAVGSVWCYSKFVNPQATVISAENKLPVNYAGFRDDNNVATPNAAIDFTQAADAAVPAVVHVKTKIPAKKVSNIKIWRPSSMLIDLHPYSRSPRKHLVASSAKRPVRF